MRNHPPIQGLIAATFTPLKPDGKLNLAAVEPVVEHLLSTGVEGLYVCGSTGEGPSLSSEERKRVAEAYVEAAAGRVPVIVQVGHNSLAEASDLARHAQASGADAISAVPPSYFKPASLDVLVACLQEVTDAAPDLPFFYYHIPQLSDVVVDVPELLERAREALPTLAGVKYSSMNVYELQACLEAAEGRYRLLFGVDEMLLSGLVAGAHGAVGSTYNFATPLYRKVTEALARGDLDEARKQQGRAVRLVRTISRYPAAPALKTVMSFIGLDCGPTRLPLTPLSGTAVSALRQELEALGFFRWIGAETRGTVEVS